MRIGVDLDDTINDFMGHFLSFYEKETGVKHSKDIFHNRQLDERLNIPKKKFLKIFNAFHTHESILQMPLLPGAKEVIHNLAKEHELFLITARLAPHSWEIDAWLSQHFKGIFKQILFAKNPYSNHNDHLKTKHEYAHELFIDVFIDDDPNFAIHIANEGFPVLMLKCPWNKNVAHQNIIIVKDWYELQKKIKDFEHERNKRSVAEKSH